MKLSTLLKPELIKSDCSSKNLDDLFTEIINTLYTTGYIKNKKAICLKLKEREKLGSTSIGNNSAIPHAKIKELEQTIVFIALSKDGVSFQNEDKKDLVNLVILILSPVNSPISHLQTLAAAASLIKSYPNFIKNTKAMSPIEILEYLKLKENEYDQ